MARLLSCPPTLIDTITDRWVCTSTPAGAATSPAELSPDTDWLPGHVPGTFAAAMRDAGAWNGQTPLELDHLDIWYRINFPGGSEERLHFEGLATIADVWLNHEHILRSENMFLPRTIAVRTRAENELHVCFRSLTAWLRSQRGRARWRTRLVTPSSLRFARTTLLGRMPGWCPLVHPVGPWRPISRLPRDQPHVHAIDARTSVRDRDGQVALRVVLDGEIPPSLTPTVEIGGTHANLARVTDREFAGDIVIPDVALWWPHTHGVPHLHHVTLRLGDAIHDLGRIGFRTIEIDRDTDGQGFGLRINGEAIFCRGACWTTPDIVTLPCDAASYRPWLESLCDAGANMVRVGGTMVYEADPFFALCDELGLLVWQDAMLANFDYPTTDEFHASLTQELEHFLHRTQLSPSLAVFCGGSEVVQQAAMFGLPVDRIDDGIYRTIIPQIVRRIRPDLAYVPNSPSGGALPFMTNTGVTHYYGVGAYRRPLDDARRAEVRFASECLALANVPGARTVDERRVSSITDPRWKQAVPRDPGAGWDFDDIRDHYLATLFKLDPLHLRYADFPRYLALSRAVNCILLEETFNEWRRVGSTCRGGLVWQWQDVIPGAGWGLIDSLGRRKPIWYAAKRAWRSRRIILTDEGLNGLAMHILNETDATLHATLRLACFKDSATPVREAEQPITVAPRSAMRLDSVAVFPGFFDITYAYRFGPRSHDVTFASLHDRVTGALLTDTCHFPNMAALQVRDIGLEVSVNLDEQGWSLRLLSQHFAQFVHIDDAAFVPTEDWLHLAPGHERRISLSATDESAAPRGEVSALNMDRIVRYAGRL